MDGPRWAGSFAPRLVVMAKVPVAGRVKTRLARDVGAGRATWIYRHTLAGLIQRVARQGHWRVILSVTPNSQCHTIMLPPVLARIGQGRGDIGARMARPFRTLPPGPVVLIGADLPQVRAAHVRQAFHLLRRHDAVFGPADDGGFWLAGFNQRARHRAAFGSARWSSEHALDDTLAGLGKMRIAFAATLCDLDDGPDLARLGGVIGRRLLPPESPTGNRGRQRSGRS